MKYTILVKPRSKKESVTLEKDGFLVVRVNALPLEGEANKRVVELIAKHFKTTKTSVRILIGLQSKKKIVEVL